jgi:phage terminase Nu1 subunit (DNA packaging protein)
MPIMTATELANHYGVDRRTITNWVNSTPPCPSWKDGTHRKFDTVKVDEWKMAKAVAEAMANIGRRAPDDMAEAELRKAVADALLAEVRAAKEEGSVVPLDLHEQVVGEMGDRAMAVIQNIPSTYAIRLEQLGISPREARAVLEVLQEDLVLALRGVADEMGDESPAED